ncbi:hypothetical protein N7457_008203 [Penicillium paradoxum]|uniref:uncharacterized protein n=1 Tax=Penicillium paradoxum TaxID=176176 RepID=UPI0025482BD9|nr:uncharacterized protein N7457_008203 [Penicillium paradoxum]KAJ5773307.1 hypothetical protein N7457_008203 [Penicillium paradoxum]
MTPREPSEPNSSPAKRRRTTSRFDRNHEFLMRCLLESSGRVDFAAVGKSQGITRNSAKYRFYRLKGQLASQDDTSHTVATKTRGKQQTKQVDQDTQNHGVDATSTETAGNHNTRPTNDEEDIAPVKIKTIDDHKKIRIKKEEDVDSVNMKTIDCHKDMQIKKEEEDDDDSSIYEYK